jgi:predicted 3-demethylubiquinone-9 3-methyltransferase (glyoxalase superfamily)
MQRITPFLWFNAQAEDARDFHLSVFRNSHPGTTTLHCEDGPGQAGSVMTANLELDGQEFVAVNGGSLFRFSPAISIVVNCETQVEVDAYWERLSAGGEQQACGWLKNRFGVSWQIVPRLRIRTLADSDRHRAARVMKAMMQIKKIVIAELEGAWNAR